MKYLIILIAIVTLTACSEEEKTEILPVKTRTFHVEDDYSTTRLDITAQNGAVVKVNRLDKENKECNFSVHGVSMAFILGRSTSPTQHSNDYTTAIIKENLILNNDNVDFSKEGMRAEDGFILTTDGCTNFNVTIIEW